MDTLSGGSILKLDSAKQELNYETVNPEKLKAQCVYYKEGYEQLLKENQELKDKKKLIEDSLESTGGNEEALKNQISFLEKEIAESRQKHLLEVDKVKTQSERRERELKEEIAHLR